jgi:hypothetical protein
MPDRQTDRTYANTMLMNYKDKVMFQSLCYWIMQGYKDNVINKSYKIMQS